MKRIIFFTNSFNIFAMFIIVSFINIIATVHFMSIFLAGTVFVAFIICLKNKFWYSLVLVIFTYVFIEISHGLNIGILTLLSLFIYIFIKEKIKNYFTSDLTYIVILLFIFYLGIFILFMINYDLDFMFIYIIFLNYFIDLLVLSFLLGGI